MGSVIYCCTLHYKVKKSIKTPTYVTKMATIANRSAENEYSHLDSQGFRVQGALLPGGSPYERVGHDKRTLETL